MHRWVIGALVGLVALSGLAGRPHAVSAAPSLTLRVPPEPPRDLGALLSPILAKHDVPAIAAAIVDGDRITALGVAGVRKRGDDTKATIDDLWHIGSCTKSLTATMVGTMVDDGSLKWTTTIGESFPELAAAGKLHESWKSVTLDQLLTHRAGVPSDLSFDGLWGKLYKAAADGVLGIDQRKMLAEAILARPPESEPGTKFLYSNAGFAIAGVIAERKAGKPWEQLMQERLFAPLGMASAGFGAPGNGDGSGQPWGHRASGKPQKPGIQADNPAGIGPGGTVHCTISDWAKYIAMHVQGDAANPNRACCVLKPETFDRLHTPPVGAQPAYAMGWSVTTRPWAKGTGEGDTGLVLTHNGSNTMWFAVCWLAPEQDFAVLIVCNQGGKPGEQACDEVAGALIGLHAKANPESSRGRGSK